MFGIFKKDSKKDSSCCNIQIQEVEETKEDCCSTEEKQECCPPEEKNKLLLTQLVPGIVREVDVDWHLLYERSVY